MESAPARFFDRAEQLGVDFSLERRALLAVVRICHAHATADDAAAALRPVVALVADADQGGGANERVADDALAVA